MSQAQPNLFGVPLKYISLVTLTVQNSLLTILLHYSRAYGSPYSAASAVLLNELLKGSISFGVALYNDYHSASYGELEEKRARSPYDSVTLFMRLRKLKKEILSPDCWKLSIPAILYVIQNNLQFVAASNLDVATFQVTYQMKILTTALFSVLMLKRRLTPVKWAALLGLALGVGIVQIQAGQASGSSSHQPLHAMNPVTGFTAVAAACMTSGLAGVYFEMVLKGSQADLWVRNVQLAGFSIVPALLPAFFPNFRVSSLVDLDSYAGLGGTLSNVMTRVFSSSSDEWMFSGFGFWAWSVVLCQVFGGLITALVIKFSDNIMKGFATSLSIMLSFIAGIILFDFQITLSFVVGCSVVLGSTYVYNSPAQAPVKPSAFNTPSTQQIPFLATPKNSPEPSDSYNAKPNRTVSLNFDVTDTPVSRRPYDVATPPGSAAAHQLRFGSPSEQPYGKSAPLFR